MAAWSRDAVLTGCALMAASRDAVFNYDDNLSMFNL